ncbi:immunoglobulin lambda-1 light chain-like isoform X1 [Podarcis raffonei]|uniref:immunoglobulin lambda-1 light chain-like isoform X1 n=1 Tax=Podarcis raffonei TaxID=65483 RepID=UPI00232917F4|nr:immunoglobulin lambda-1 light chain-like isoform X1 [Podarcis raffonei]
MAWALSFLVLLGYLSGVISQPTMTQPASVAAPPRQTTKLSCTASGSVSYIVWIQQKPGQAPRFVHCDGCSRGTGIPDRFTASRSGTTGYLTITGTETEDEADYYCVAWFSSMFVFGGGTHLTVLGQPTVPPTVNVFPPSPEELKSSDKATAVCLMDGFYPGTVQVTWQADGATISSGVETTTPTKLNDKYAASSYLSMRKSDWESYETVICKVTHDGKTVEKVVRRLDCA